MDLGVWWWGMELGESGGGEWSWGSLVVGNKVGVVWRWEMELG